MFSTDYGSLMGHTWPNGLECQQEVYRGAWMNYIKFPLWYHFTF